MILDDIAAQRLPRRAPVRWGDLRVGDTITCPHDATTVETVTISEAGHLVGDWRVVVDAGHFHARPSSDVAPAVQDAGESQ